MTSEQEFEERVGTALHREADTVEPSGGGLQTIQARTAGGVAGRARARWWGGAAVLATAATVAAIAVAGAGGLGLPGDLEPAGPGETQRVEVFYLDATPERRGEPGSETVDDPGLYRELHDVAADTDRLEAAVRELVSGTPEDPDYDNFWAGVEVSSVEVRGDRAVVDLAEHPGPVSFGPSQQLAHTVKFNAEGIVIDVEVTVRGEPLVDATPAPPAQAYAGIWVQTPTQGATVGSPVTFSGMAATFEGNVAYEILRGGEVVARGATITEGGMGVWSEWSFTERLQPGDYTVVAFDEDPALGGRRDVDTKTFSVQ